MFPRALLLFAATPLFAQFSQFVATDDGKQLYFISSLTSYNTPAGPHGTGMLYRIGPDGLTYVAGVGLSNVSNPQVSGDGSLTGFTFLGDCNLSCSPQAQLQYGGQTKPLGPGSLQLSRSGRWALVTPTQANTTVATLIDPVTNFAAQVAQLLMTPFRTLASDGTVLVQNGLWKQGQVTPLPSIPGFSFAPQALSDNAATIVAFAFQPRVQGSIRMVALRVASGRSTTLYQSTMNTLPIFMALSNDGTRALFRVTPLASGNGEAYFVDTTTGQSTAIALPTGEFATDGTLSGDGSIAFLVTSLGRIVKVTLASGTVEPLIPATPFLANVNQLAIGSLVHLQTAYPAADWTGQILLNQQPLPVLSVKPGEVDVQIPWEQPAGPAELQLGFQTGTPFQQVQSVFVSPFAPAFEPLDPGETAIFPIKIIKGDWSGLQTTQPRAGDIVYIYMTGLGPVTNPVQTGVPASLTTPNPIQESITCTFTPQTTPAETLFAGLAPGTIGIYQVAFRIPSDPNTLPLNGMNCGSFGFGLVLGSSVP